MYTAGETHKYTKTKLWCMWAREHYRLLQASYLLGTCIYKLSSLIECRWRTLHHDMFVSSTVHFIALNSAALNIAVDHKIHVF